MEIEVGEYARTDRGLIVKADVDWFIDILIKGKSAFGKPVKHSKDIIDLIEEGDYVNGCKVYEVREDEIVVYLDRQPINCYNYIMADEIKSIVTKEQIKQIEYRIGD